MTTANNRPIAIRIGSAMVLSFLVFLTGCAELVSPGAGAPEDGTEEQPRPGENSSQGEWIALSAGGDHTCGVTSDRKAYCWGAGANGALGTGSITDTRKPEEVNGEQVWSTIVAGHKASCAITVVGDAYCWGGTGGTARRLGNGTYTGSTTPVLVSGGHKWSEIAMSGSLICGITTSAEGYCWGMNDDGQVGNGKIGVDEHVDYPTRLSGEWASIDPGDDHACGIRTSGVGYCWGRRRYGSLGDGQGGTYAVPEPTPVMYDLNWRHLAAGNDITYALSDNGALYRFTTDGLEPVAPDVELDQVWAENRYFCGLAADKTSHCLPLDIEWPADWVDRQIWISVDPGRYHACGITTDGRGYCWGRNRHGEIGPGAAGDLQETPVEVFVPQAT